MLRHTREGVPVAKGQALGNDYIVVDAAELPGDLSTAQARALCDRHRGVGSDGVLLGDVARKPLVLRIFNPDGSEAEKSGNGLRIFGAWLHGRGLVRTGERFRVRLPKDEVEMVVEGEVGGGALMLAVAMGVPAFLELARGRQGDEATGRRGARDSGYTLDLGNGLSAVVHPLSLANPHCVVIVDELDRAEFLARAPRLCTHPAFPAGTNVQFARVAGEATMEAWIWERGVGETLASGSSSCAVAAVARRLGLVESSTITVRMPGGSVRIDVDPDDMLHLRGPAQVVFEGVVPLEVWRAWAGA